MGQRLERFGEVRIIDETNGFGLNFVEKTESRFEPCWLSTKADQAIGRAANSVFPVQTRPVAW